MKLKSNFHSRLFGFSGFSESGKTTLIEKMIRGMKDYRIGYIKHDAHRFSIDHEGKDTFRQYAAGAQVVFINDSDHFAMQVKGQSFTLEKEFFKDCDLVFVEGHKYADHPKFLFLDDEGFAEQEYREGKITNILGTISIGTDLRALEGLPSFHRDDIQGLINFIVNEMNRTLEKVELLGLVLAGGKSSRMGHDKALIDYHGKPQAKYLLEMLEEANIKSYLSCREDQLDQMLFKNAPIITDRFLDFGPLGGILSAMSLFPGKAWLVCACDLPLVSSDMIATLIAERDPFKQATSFFNKSRKQFEPLFAIYEPHIYTRMLHYLGEGVLCPQKVLFNSSIKRLKLETQRFLENANTPEEKVRIQLMLEGENL